jgi:hypothetical protein
MAAPARGRKTGTSGVPATEKVTQLPKFLSDRLPKDPNALLAEPPTGKRLVVKVPRRTTPRQIDRKFGFDPYAPPGAIALLCAFLKGGKRTFMEFARLAVKIDPNLQDVLKTWDDSHPTIQKKMDLDQLCEIKEVDPIHLILAAAEAGLRFQKSAVLLVAAINSPAVIEAIVKRALQAEGTEEKKMLLHMYGALPVAKGAQIMILNQMAAKAEINRGEEGDDSPFPTIEDTVFASDKLMRRVQEERRRR